MNRIFIKKSTVMTMFAVILIFMVGIIFFFLRGVSFNEEKGAANGKTALDCFKNIAGDSRVETLADIRDAKKSGEFVEFLTRNSIYVLDDEAVEIYVESYLTAAESTAQAGNMSLDDLIVKEWGYENIDAYKEEARELAHAFIKERLAVYTLADEKGIQVKQGEYEKNLSQYALKFGYATSQEFEYACTPASIANEMLYDKTLKEFQ